MKKIINTAEFIPAGFKRNIFKCIQPLFDHFSGFSKLNQFNVAIQNGARANNTTFHTQALELFSITREYDSELACELQKPGPRIIATNHPYGCIDAMAIMELADQSKGGHWKLIANKLLKEIDSLTDYVIVVDPFAKGAAKRENLKSVRVMQQLLKDNGTLIIFPAGRVSGWSDSLNAVCDLDWTDHPLKMAIKYNATLTLAHISGQNSDKFLTIDPAQLNKRSMRLAKEVDIQQNKHIKISHSISMTPEQLKKIESYSNSTEILKALSYIGSDKTKPTEPKEIDLAQVSEKSSGAFHSLLTKSTEVLCEQGDFTSFMIQGKDNPEVMQEVGRLREITFQAIGAGSGKPIDLSPEDDYYHHIVVTDSSNGEIIGAYRIGFTKEILENQGIDGLYLNHVFKFDPAFFTKLGDSMELSRSFIIPTYQKSPQVLDLLWKSLGTVATERGIEKQFGSVTISADYTPLSQAILVDTLDKSHSAPAELREKVTNKSEFTATTTYHAMVADAFAPHGLNRLNTIIEDIEGGYRPIPPLMRYYASLGAKFLSFKVEPTFNNAIYCLLVLDLKKMPNRYQKRFLNARPHA